MIAGAEFLHIDSGSILTNEILLKIADKRPNRVEVFVSYCVESVLLSRHLNLLYKCMIRLEA
jgi:hypothetical protein